MKKEISFTATMIWECDDEYEEEYDFSTFNKISNADYDNVGRPIYHLEDVGWKITNKEVKDLK